MIWWSDNSGRAARLRGEVYKKPITFRKVSQSGQVEKNYNTFKPLMCKIFKLMHCIIYCKLSGGQAGYRVHEGY